jgi:aminoglycoside N3'-acetyltransferase
MVHAGMRAIGPVEGGAAGVITAICEALGPTGTMVMVLGADPDEPFDAATTEVDIEDMGVLAEVFRTTVGVQVNDHAAARYGVLGPHADALLSDLPLDDYHGPGSVLDRLNDADGLVLRLGASPDTVTLTHLAEYRCRVPDKRRTRVRYVRADTGEHWIECLDDDNGIVEWNKGDYFTQVLVDFRAAGGIRSGPVGGCAGELFEARAFTDFAVEWMNREL